MSVILNIETSSTNCSVALSKDGMVLCERMDMDGMNHAERLAPFVDECMQDLRRREEKLDAVSISIGPGSYTGLRIGLSLAKGLAFSSDVPLIGISTLMLLAVKGMFSSMEWDGEEVFIPMIDARRMEVYAGAYDFALTPLLEEKPVILDDTSFMELKERKIVFLGNGAAKFKEICKLDNVVWIDNVIPLARDMMPLSEKFLKEGRFIDIAYSVPNYLKEYQTTIPKNKVIGCN